MEYSKQLFYKEKEVKNNLEKIGKIKVKELLPIKGAKKKYFYRNKMEFSFSNNRWLSYDEIQSQQQIKERNALGFHIPGMWDKILDINKCWLQEDPSNEIRNKIKEFATKNLSLIHI